QYNKRSFDTSSFAVIIESIKDSKSFWDYVFPEICKIYSSRKNTILRASNFDWFSQLQSYVSDSLENNHIFKMRKYLIMICSFVDPLSIDNFSEFLVSPLFCDVLLDTENSIHAIFALKCLPFNAISLVIEYTYLMIKKGKALAFLGIVDSL